MIMALCLSYFALFSNGVNITRTIGERFFSPTDYVQTSNDNLLGYGESIDYYQNGDYLTDFNTDTQSFYGGYDSGNAPYYDYTYHNSTYLDMTLTEGVKYNLTFGTNYMPNHDFIEDMYIGYFCAYYDSHSTLEDTQMIFVFQENQNRIKANLDIDIDIYYINDLNVTVHTFHIPLYRPVYSANNGYYRFDLPSINVNTQNDQVLIDFKVSLVDMDIALTDFYQEGYGTGYDIGYGEGYTNGYNIGHQGDTNTFRGLLGALIDTPILFLRKFFGYTVFGVDIYAALATMISLIVALSVFRLVRSIV